MADSGIYVYVSENGSEQISVWSLAPATGELTKVQDMAVHGNVMPLAISPDRRFMYASLRDDPDCKIVSLAIDGQTGMLTQIGITQTVSSPVYLSTDRTGRYLIAANNPRNYDHRTGVLTVHTIGDQGCVQAPYQMFRTPPKLHSARPDPSNRFLFAASCDGDGMVRHAFDAVTGIVDPDPLPLVGIERKRGPRHFIFHPNNRFMYLVNEYDASVYAFRYDVRNGSLAEIQIAKALPQGFEVQDRGRHLGISAAAADLHFTLDGKWLYVSTRASLTIHAFAVDPLTGLLTPAGDFPVAKEPRGFNIDPHGRYLIAAADVDNTLTTFRINAQTGALTKVAERPTGKGPNWVECVRLP